MRTFKVAKAGAGLRADAFIAKKMPGFSRSTLKSLFDGMHAKLNGRPVKASQKLSVKDELSIETSSLNSKPQVVELPVIFENDDVIVMNKSSGMLTHSKGAINLEPTVASFVLTKITDKTLTGNRAGIVHRLDRGTSGVIIAAKNSPTLKFLQKQFSQRKVKKSYLAIVEGVPEPETASIDAPIGRNPKRPQSFKVTASGKPAQTDYKVLKQLAVDGRTVSLLELRPKTGRTHQLRVHLAYLGHPILNDSLYGRGEGQIKLHAAELELALPGGARQIFKVSPPKDFEVLA